MLGGLHRNGRNGEEVFEIVAEDDEEEAKQSEANKDPENQPSQEKKQRKRFLKFNDTQGQKTLEKEENINLREIDTEFLVDPLFRQTTQKFDEMGQGTLIGNRLNVTPSLQLQLDSSLPYNHSVEQSKYRGKDSKKAHYYLNSLNSTFEQGELLRMIPNESNYMSNEMEHYMHAHQILVNKLVSGV